MRLSHACIVALALCAGTTAQGSLTEGTASFRLVNIPAGPTATSGGTADFMAGGTVDQLYRTWWFYRLAGDTRETPFNTANGQLTQTWSGQTALLRFGDVDRRGFSADLQLQLYTPAAGSAVLTQRMTLTNRTSAPLTVQLFLYADFDVCGGFQNLAIHGVDGTRHVITENCLDRIEFVAAGADRFDASSYPGAYARLTDNTLFDLGNGSLPYGPGDYTGAFQWQDRILQPNEPVTFSSGFAHNLVDLCSNMAETLVYGSAKGAPQATPQLGSPLPFHGTRITLSLTNGLGGAMPILIIGSQQTSLSLGSLGTLYTDPLVSFALRPFDTSGNTAFNVTMPRRPVLCGFSCYWQAFFLDQAAPGGMAHTAGLQWTIGGL